MSSTYKNLLLLALAAVAIASPLPQSSSESTEEAQSVMDVSPPSWDEMSTLRVVTPLGAQCFLLGNPEFYPLGLRAGIYLQWFATIFANFFVPSVAPSMRGVNTLFQLAVFSGLSYAVTNMGTLDGIEGFILLTLCIGGISSLITSPNMDVRVTRAGSIARLSIFLAVFIFGAWYWFVGMNYMAITACTQQIQFLFFWKVHLYHWFMSFSKAVMIIGSLSVGAALVWELFSLSTVLRIQGVKPSMMKMLKGTLHKESVLGGILLQEKYAWVSGALLVVLTVVTAAFVVTIEGALKHSNTFWVSKLNSPAELIPFIVGLASLIKVLVGMVSGALKVVNEGMSRSDIVGGKESRPGSS